MGFGRTSLRSSWDLSARSKRLDDHGNARAIPLDGPGRRRQPLDLRTWRRAPSDERGKSRHDDSGPTRVRLLRNRQRSSHWRSHPRQRPQAPPFLGVNTHSHDDPQHTHLFIRHSEPRVRPASQLPVRRFRCKRWLHSATPPEPACRHFNAPSASHGQPDCSRRFNESRDSTSLRGRKPVRPATRTELSAPTFCTFRDEFSTRRRADDSDGASRAWCTGG